MDRSQLPVIAVVLLVAGAIGYVAVAEAGLAPAPWADNRDDATVRISDDAGPIATVDVRVADTPKERYEGLSGTKSLPDGEGMWFVFDGEAQRTFVMREMNYGLDMIFVGEDGRITTIHHARPPGPGEDGNDLRYRGRARWVLELPRGYANETGIEVRDRAVLAD